MSDVNRPFVSVIVPCRCERDYIAACLDSILATDYPRDRLEVLVVDGMSDDGTRDIVRQFAEQDPVVRLVDNPMRITPCALNIGIRTARGAVVLRMDAHVAYPPAYISSLVTGLLESGADNVGAVLETAPANDTTTAKAIAVALGHPLGVGNSYFRIGTKVPRWVDTIAFFCCRRELFDRVGMFDEELVRHQDGEFNARLIKHGGRILLLPDVTCRYYARGSLKQVARMFFQYGYFKPLVARKVGRFMTARQLIPPAFVITLLGLGALSIWWPLARPALAGVAASYTIAIAVASLMAARRCGLGCALRLMLVFPTLHLTYGLGFWRRALELLIRPGRKSADATALPLSR